MNEILQVNLTNYKSFDYHDYLTQNCKIVETMSITYDYC